MVEREVCDVTEFQLIVRVVTKYLRLIIEN
jgi:hypothetical protein